MKTLFTIFGLAIVASGVYSQSIRDEKRINKTIPVTVSDGFTVKISNIDGDVEVYATDKNEVLVDLKITVKADNQSDLDKGMRELSLKERLDGKMLKLGMEAPFIVERWRDGELVGMQIEDCPDYGYRYDFKVGVPRSASLKASTVNDGDVLIGGIEGVIRANNVNGSIEIEEAMEVKVASTVNGDVTVTYSQNPTRNGYFHSINGDIILKMQPNLNASVYSKSMNGELFSSYNFEYLKPVVVKSEKSSRRGTVYKINEKTGIRIGSGGPEIKIETLNGNMYLKMK